MGIEKNEIIENEKKTRSKKKYVLLLLLLLLVSVTVGYAILSTSINISGKTKIKDNWKINAVNIECPPSEKCTINPNDPEKLTPDPGDNIGAVIWLDGDTVYFKHILNQPGQVFTFTVEYINNGEIDAKVSKVIQNKLNATAEKYLTYSVTYADGRNVNEEDELNSGSSLKFKVTVAYKKAITVLPTKEELDLINEVAEGHTGATSLFKVEFVQK